MRESSPPHNLPKKGFERSPFVDPQYLEWQESDGSRANQDGGNGAVENPHQSRGQQDDHDGMFAREGVSENETQGAGVGRSVSLEDLGIDEPDSDDASGNSLDEVIAGLHVGDDAREDGIVLPTHENEKSSVGKKKATPQYALNRPSVSGVKSSYSQRDSMPSLEETTEASRKASIDTVNERIEYWGKLIETFEQVVKDAEKLAKSKDIEASSIPTFVEMREILDNSLDVFKSVKNKFDKDVADGSDLAKYKDVTKLHSIDKMLDAFHGYATAFNHAFVDKDKSFVKSFGSLAEAQQLVDQDEKSEVQKSFDNSLNLLTKLKMEKDHTVSEEFDKVFGLEERDEEGNITFKGHLAGGGEYDEEADKAETRKQNYENLRRQWKVDFEKHKEAKDEYERLLKEYYEKESDKGFLRRSVGAFTRFVTRVGADGESVSEEVARAKEEYQVARKKYAIGLRDMIKNRGDYLGEEEKYEGKYDLSHDKMKAAYGRKFILKPGVQQLQIQKEYLKNSETGEMALAHAKKIGEVLKKNKWKIRAGSVAIAAGVGLASGGVLTALIAGSWKGAKIAAGIVGGAKGGVAGHLAFRGKVKEAETAQKTALENVTKNFSIDDLEKLETALVEADKIKDKKIRQQRIAMIMGAVAGGGGLALADLQFELGEQLQDSIVGRAEASEMESGVGTGTTKTSQESSLKWREDVKNFSDEKLFSEKTRFERVVDDEPSTQRYLNKILEEIESREKGEAVEIVVEPASTPEKLDGLTNEQLKEQVVQLARKIMNGEDAEGDISLFNEAQNILRERDVSKGELNELIEQVKEGLGTVESTNIEVDYFVNYPLEINETSQKLEFTYNLSGLGELGPLNEENVETIVNQTIAETVKEFFGNRHMHPDTFNEFFVNSTLEEMVNEALNQKFSETAWWNTPDELGPDSKFEFKSFKLLGEETEESLGANDFNQDESGEEVIGTGEWGEKDVTTHEYIITASDGIDRSVSIQGVQPIGENWEGKTLSDNVLKQAVQSVIAKNTTLNFDVGAFQDAVRDELNSPIYYKPGGTINELIIDKVSINPTDNDAFSAGVDGFGTSEDSEMKPAEELAPLPSYEVQKGDNFWDVTEGDTEANRPPTLDKIPENKQQALIDLARDEINKDSDLREQLGAFGKDASILYEDKELNMDLLDDVFERIAREQGWLSTEIVTPPDTTELPEILSATEPEAGEVLHRFAESDHRGVTGIIAEDYLGDRMSELTPAQRSQFFSNLVDWMQANDEFREQFRGGDIDLYHAGDTVDLGPAIDEAERLLELVKSNQLSSVSRLSIQPEDYEEPVRINVNTEALVETANPAEVTESWVVPQLDSVPANGLGLRTAEWQDFIKNYGPERFERLVGDEVMRVEVRTYPALNQWLGGGFDHEDVPLSAFSELKDMSLNEFKDMFVEHQQQRLVSGDSMTTGVSKFDEVLGELSKKDGAYANEKTIEAWGRLINRMREAVPANGNTTLEDLFSRYVAINQIEDRPGMPTRLVPDGSGVTPLEEAQSRVSARAADSEIGEPRKLVDALNEAENQVEAGAEAEVSETFDMSEELRELINDRQIAVAKGDGLIEVPNSARVGAMMESYNNSGGADRVRYNRLLQIADETGKVIVVRDQPNGSFAVELMKPEQVTAYNNNLLESVSTSPSPSADQVVTTEEKFGGRVTSGGFNRTETVRTGDVSESTGGRVDSREEAGFLQRLQRSIENIDWDKVADIDPLYVLDNNGKWKPHWKE